MKFEVKTQNDDIWKSSFSVFLSVALFSLLIVFSNISIKMGAISRYYEMKYLCNLLTIEKSTLNFKKLSKLTNQNTKQKMWELCREIIK